MNINIKGTYKFIIPLKNGTNRIIYGENLITFFGESFFLNRPINDDFNTMKYIVLGNGTNRPKKMDNKLGNETIRKECVKQADLDNKRILLSVKLTTSEIIGTTEIGVANDDILISHDVYEKITNETITDAVGEINIEYSFQLSTSSIRSDWNKIETEPYSEFNIYYCGEPNEVIGVVEDNTKCGYRKVNELDELIVTTGAYFYNRSLGLLYIHNTKNTNPIYDTIIVQTK